jgi:hypothetical protein
MKVMKEPFKKRLKSKFGFIRCKHALKVVYLLLCHIVTTQIQAFFTYNFLVKVKFWLYIFLVLSQKQIERVRYNPTTSRPINFLISSNHVFHSRCGNSSLRPQTATFYLGMLMRNTQNDHWHSNFGNGVRQTFLTERVIL